MWAHYADEHKGVCIGFKEQLIRPEGSMIYPIDVTYQDNYPFKEIIERFHHFEHQPGMNNIQNIAGDILYSVLGTKYTSWSYERERRLVFVSSKAVEFSPEWSHVKWFQAVKSKSKYALEFERI